MFLFFFPGYTTHLLRIHILTLSETAVLRSVCKGSHQEILQMNPSEFHFARQDIYKHLPSFPTENAALWVLHRGQDPTKLVHGMATIRESRRSLMSLSPTERKQLHDNMNGYRHESYAGEQVFFFRLRAFCLNISQEILLQAASRFDSVELLRMVAMEVYTHNLTHPIHQKPK